jgi:hypothetical protein
VALISNPRTQFVSPQYHVIFDEDFETVESADPATMEANITMMFDQLFQDHEWIHCDMTSLPSNGTIFETKSNKKAGSK